MPFKGYVDPQRPNPDVAGDATIIIYGYVPAVALCGLGIATFSLAFIAHLIRTIQGRSWSTVPLIVACAMELVGYIARTLSSRVDPYRVSYFVVQYFLIVTAPILVTATMYICLTKMLGMMQRHGVRSAALIEKLGFRLILWVFITADIITTVVQVAGAALIGSTTSKHNDPTTANNIVLAGIAIQTFFFIIYLALLTRTLVTVRLARSILPLRLGRFVPALFVASLCILLRLIFRLAETGDGVFGYLSSHEAFFGALEYVPVLVAMVLLAVWHPASVFKVHETDNPTGLTDSPSVERAATGMRSSEKRSPSLH